MTAFGTPAGTAALGIWIKIPTPEVLEVIAGSGVDFVVIDCEHGPIDRGMMSTMVGVARGLDLGVFVRVGGHSASELVPPLDAGADGLFVPHVDSAATAQQIVRACRFPPLGSRPGSLATRAGRWGRCTLTDYVSRANSEITIVAQIESPQAVASVAAIAAVAGLDAVFVGPFDLALSAGVDPAGAELRELIDRVEAATPSKVVGGVANNSAEAAQMAERGYSFVMVGADISLLGSALSSLSSDIRETVSRTTKGTT